MKVFYFVGWDSVIYLWVVLYLYFWYFLFDWLNWSLYIYKNIVKFFLYFYCLKGLWLLIVKFFVIVKCVVVFVDFIMVVRFVVVWFVW